MKSTLGRKGFIWLIIKGSQGRNLEAGDEAEAMEGGCLLASSTFLSFLFLSFPFLSFRLSFLLSFPLSFLISFLFFGRQVLCVALANSVDQVGFKLT